MLFSNLNNNLLFSFINARYLRTLVRNLLVVTQINKFFKMVTLNLVLALKDYNSIRF